MDDDSGRVRNCARFAYVGHRFISRICIRKWTYVHLQGYDVESARGRTAERELFISEQNRTICSIEASPEILWQKQSAIGACKEPEGCCTRL